MGDACDPGSMKPTRLVGHVVWWWGSAPFAIGYPVAVRGLRLRNDTGRHGACGLFATSHGSGDLRVGGVSVTVYLVFSLSPLFFFWA